MGPRWTKARMGLVTAIVVASLLFPAPLVPAGREDGRPCHDFQNRHGIGDSCRRADGLYEIFSRDGRTSHGFTHGLDPVPAEGDGGPFEAESAQSVVCVDGAPGTYYTRVIYARAVDDADGYASAVAAIRSLTEDANSVIGDAAASTGGTASLRVKCAGGAIEVADEVLPTPKASASFSTIVSDLRVKGYTDGKVHHWVYYDDPSACSCGGTGHIYGDDSLAASNLHNGNGGALFAVTFGYLSTRIWLHELGHNMGAVQTSAPSATGGWHCIDGQDIMCYNDEGPNGHLYSTTSCAVEVFDCGKNDYFDLDPAAGSYLSTHWNLGSLLNRFLQFGGTDTTPPTVTITSPTSGATYETGGSPLSLGGTASDNAGVTQVTWVNDRGGSGIASGTGSWSVSGIALRVGTNVLTLTARDGAGNTATDTLTVSFTPSEFTRPVLTVVDPAIGMTYLGCVKVPGTAIDPVYVRQACVTGTASDSGSGLRDVKVYHNGVLRATSTTSPFFFQYGVAGPALAHDVLVVATDYAGNTASETRLVNVV